MNTEIMPVQAHTETTGLIAMIERVALSPDADIDKLERLLAMQERILAKQAESEFSRSMADMQGQMTRIVEKSKTNNSKYAPLEDINREIQPHLKAHGFSLFFTIEQTEGFVTVRACLVHRAGHKECTTVTLPFDGGTGRNAVQAIGSSITYGRRYALCSLLNISTGDDDGNSAMQSDAYTQEEIDALKKALMDANEKTKDEFKAKYKLISDVPRSLYRETLKKAQDNKESL